MKSVPIPVVPPGAKCSEFVFMQALHRACNAPGRTVRLFRSNVGTVQLRNRAGQRTGVFHAGPVVGASDLQGLATVVVHGLTLAIYLAVEVKVDAPISEAQQRYIDFINRSGGVGLVVRYSHALSLAANVEAGVRQVDAAVAARVGSDST